MSNMYTDQQFTEFFQGIRQYWHIDSAINKPLLHISSYQNPISMLSIERY